MVGETGMLLVRAAVVAALVGGDWLVIFENGTSQLPPEQIQSNSCQWTLQCVCQTGALLAASRSAGAVMVLLAEDSGCGGCWKFCAIW